MKKTLIENNRKKTSDEKKEKTRLRILMAARKCFAKNGFESTNVSDIVGKIDMSQGTFYYHFPDKKSILLELLRDFFERGKNLASYWAGTSEVGPDVTAHFSHLVATLLYENQDIARIIMKETYNPDPDVHELIYEFYNYLYEQTALALALGIQIGAVRPMDTRIAAIALVGMLKEVVFNLIDTRGKIKLDHVIDEISTLQNRGIRPAPPA